MNFASSIERKNFMGDICKIDLRIFFVYSQESYWNHTWKFIGSSIQMNFHSKPMNFLLLCYFWHLDAALAPNFFARPALRNSHCKGTENCINAPFCIFRCLKFSNEYINMLVNLNSNNLSCWHQILSKNQWNKRPWNLIFGR